MEQWWLVVSGVMVANLPLFLMGALFATRPIAHSWLDQTLDIQGRAAYKVPRDGIRPNVDRAVVLQPTCHE